MKISMIAALDENYGIGAKNALLWHLPDDFKWFKQHTIGKPVIMGRQTMLSLGKPLPNRLNMVLSSDPSSVLPGFEHAFSIHEAIEKLSEYAEVFVIGGGQIYNAFLPMAHALYLTFVKAQFEGVDTYFPRFSAAHWQETFREAHGIDDRHAYAFDLCVFERQAEVVI
jgi:dihydrofolate reductase